MTERTWFCDRCHRSNQYVSKEHDSFYINKRVFGPGVAHLKMTVYKGIAKHSFSHSPAMVFIDQ